jgi:phosphohistidine phosphatase
MELYILRHAPAVERGTPGYENDASRPLTSQGEKKMYRVAKGMLALGLEFDLVLSSPFVRARRTAEIVVEVFRCRKKLKCTEKLATHGNPRALIEEINTKHGSPESLVLVGHEPYLSNLISTLVAGDERTALTLKKGGLCKVTVSSLRYGKCARLEWLLTPRQMTRIQ